MTQAGVRLDCINKTYVAREDAGELKRTSPIEEGRVQCTDNCMSCKEDKNTCEARKERRRWINRMKYKAKKEYERKKGKS